MKGRTKKDFLKLVENCHEVMPKRIRFYLDNRGM